MPDTLKQCKDCEFKRDMGSTFAPLRCWFFGGKVVPPDGTCYIQVPEFSPQALAAVDPRMRVSSDRYCSFELRPKITIYFDGYVRKKGINWAARVEQVRSFNFADVLRAALLHYFNGYKAFDPDKVKEVKREVCVHTSVQAVSTRNQILRATKHLLVDQRHRYIESRFRRKQLTKSKK